MKTDAKCTHHGCFHQRNFNFGYFHHFQISVSQKSEEITIIITGLNTASFKVIKIHELDTH